MSSKHAHEHVCAKEDLDLLTVMFARTVSGSKQKTFMPTSARKCDAKVLPKNSTIQKSVNPNVTSLIYSHHSFGVKLSMPTKHAKQTSQDCLKLDSKAWTWQGWPENKHAKQSTGQENKTCKQGLNMTGVTGKEACTIHKHVNANMHTNM